MANEAVFTMDASSIKYGPGATREVGSDLRALGATRVMLVTDPGVAQLEPVAVALESLRAAGIDAVVYDQARVEPTDGSFKDAIRFATDGGFDGFVAVGGGSSMDTAKAANLYATYPADFLAYVNAPIGRGEPVPGRLRPLIAIPTTSGTSRDLPSMVAACSGFDVLSHAIESYTALPYREREAPAEPRLRPAYQGANPISDIWAERTILMVSEFFVRAVKDPGDHEARAQMMLAATFAGIGFGNAGVHLPHGMSYPVSGMVQEYVPPGYHPDHALVPHGMSVILNAPSVFRWTASANPERHLQAATWLGGEVRGAGPQDAGHVLSSTLIELMRKTDMPNGLRAIGFDEGDVDELVTGTLPQHRVTKLAPRPVTPEDLRGLFLGALSYWE